MSANRSLSPSICTSTGALSFSRRPTIRRWASPFPAAVRTPVCRSVLAPCIVLVGDGRFQMTGSELSTAVRYRQAPVVIVLNNHGYSTEREILEGPFNDIHEWRYERICDLIGGQGSRVATHGEFVDTLAKALADPSQPYVINVLLDPPTVPRP